LGNGLQRIAGESCAKEFGVAEGRMLRGSRLGGRYAFNLREKDGELPATTFYIGDCFFSAKRACGDAPVNAQSSAVAV
jgi:hypothetical protein